VYKVVLYGVPAIKQTGGTPACRGGRTGSMGRKKKNALRGGGFGEILGKKELEFPRIPETAQVTASPDSGPGGEGRGLSR